MRSRETQGPARNLRYLRIVKDKRLSWFALPAVPAAGFYVLAFAASALGGGQIDWPVYATAAAVACVVVAAAWRVPWQHLPASWMLVIPVCCDLVVGLLRQAQGGSTSGYTPLAVLTVVWVGLVLGIWEIAAIMTCTTLLLAVPIVFIGDPLYPQNGWRGVVLWSVVAGVVGVGTNRVIAEQRRQTRLADGRLEELGRLVETQNAIATSELGSEAVMASVVDEARRLTGADAGVVELPDGPDLVYSAVSGTAEAYAGLRLEREATISGLALRTRETLVCTDTEGDDRVDREACRRVGARSMVVVPLLHAGTAMGVLKVYSTVPDAFTDEHVQVLSLLAGMIGTALARADLLSKLSEQAVTDELTGLPNRRGWYEHLAGALARARRTGDSVSVIALDVDGLKLVNDRDGHAAGDRLLREVGSRWSAVLRENDVLGRLGGDEFAVVLEGADQTAAADVVTRLAACLRDEHSASAGVATWDGVEDDMSLLSRADEAMYRQKRKPVTAH